MRVPVGVRSLQGENSLGMGRNHDEDVMLWWFQEKTCVGFVPTKKPRPVKVRADRTHALDLLVNPAQWPSCIAEIASAQRLETGIVLAVEWGHAISTTCVIGSFR